MAHTKRGGTSGEDAKAKAAASPRKADPDSVAVQAVKTTGGRAATTVHVELDPKTMAGAAASDEVEEVVAQFPRADGEPSEVRWEGQPLQKSGDVEGQSGKRVRYSATRYEESDAARYGIKVHVRTKGGDEVDTDPCGHVRDADKPDT